MLFEASNTTKPRTKAGLCEYVPRVSRRISRRIEGRRASPVAFVPLRILYTNRVKRASESRERREWESNPTSPLQGPRFAKPGALTNLPSRRDDSYAKTAPVSNLSCRDRFSLKPLKIHAAHLSLVQKRTTPFLYPSANRDTRSHNPTAPTAQSPPPLRQSSPAAPHAATTRRAAARTAAPHPPRARRTAPA